MVLPRFDGTRAARPQTGRAVTTMTDAELSEIEERANRAAPGPWTVKGRLGGDSCVAHVANANGKPLPEYDGGYAPDWPDDGTVLFVASARADVPALIAEIRALRLERDNAVNLAKHDGHFWTGMGLCGCQRCMRAR